MKQEMMRWQWHQLNHTQIICTSLQTDNHTSTSSISFYRPDALPDAQPCAFSALTLLLENIILKINAIYTLKNSQNSSCVQH